VRERERKRERESESERERARGRYAMNIDKEGHIRDTGSAKDRQAASETKHNIFLFETLSNELNHDIRSEINSHCK